jgi:hypothetical protein
MFRIRREVAVGEGSDGGGVTMAAGVWRRAGGGVLRLGFRVFSAVATMSCDDKSGYRRFRGLPQSRAVGETRGVELRTKKRR